MKNKTEQTTWGEVRGEEHRQVLIFADNNADMIERMPTEELNRGLADFERMLQENPRAEDRLAEPNLDKVQLPPLPKKITVGI